MTTILDEILEYKKLEVAKQKENTDVNELIEKTKRLPKNRSFFDELEKNKNQNKISLIAEVKKASPSKGIIRADFNPVEIAKIYENSGATAISVLTDEKYFQGSIDYLRQIRKIVEIPILRKDFIIDEFQIFQTKEMGADIILLIASAMSKEQLKDFFQISKELELDVLLEVHDRKEMEVALEINADIIGINNRNLKTFKVSLENTVNLIRDLNLKNKHFISESGIKTADDVKYLKNHGVSGILVGETLMKQKNIEKAVFDLLK